jgi:hypothetical protein
MDKEGEETASTSFGGGRDCPPPPLETPAQPDGVVATGLAKRG